MCLVASDQPLPTKGPGTLFMHVLDFHTFPCDWLMSMIGQWVRMRFYDKLVHACPYLDKAWVRG